MDDIETNEEDVTILEGHESEVFICSWSPTSSILASGFKKHKKILYNFYNIY